MVSCVLKLELMTLSSSLTGIGRIGGQGGGGEKNFPHFKARLTFSGKTCIAGGDIGVNKIPSKFDTYARPF